MKKLYIASLLAFLILLPQSGSAETIQFGSYCTHCHTKANAHAPIGVMGDHRHRKGEWMVSYRYMRMHMEDNRDGTDDLSPVEIATTVPNRFFGTPMQPSTLRVVPLEMTTDMHMFGAMYAPSDRITLMGMVNYIDREMDHVTFQGGAGTTELGNFTTETSGFGDVGLSALIGIYENETHSVHFNAGTSIPTGSIDERDDVLAPNGMRPTLRLPYAMQLGTGTFDLLPGIIYTGHHNNMGWGAQYKARFHLGNNSQGYSRGDKHQITAWGSYAFRPWVSGSLRFTAETESEIDGIDSEIVAPVQTADPDNYGGESISASAGLNFLIPNGILKNHRFSIEATLPVYQDLNGLQMKRDHMVTLGWQKSF
ncbi:MAG: transporter [Pseudomonadota bacterium]